MTIICVEDTQKLTNVQIGLNFILTSLLPLKVDIFAKVKKVTTKVKLVGIFYLNNTHLMAELSNRGVCKYSEQIFCTNQLYKTET